MPKIYFQNHVVTISYDEELQLGEAVWNGFLNSQEFRVATSACMQIIEEHKPIRWLGDNRKMKAIRPTDQEWFVEHILPRLLHSTVRRNAIVVSEDFFNRAAVDQIHKRAAGKGEMIVKEFDNKILALSWLKSPIPVPAAD